jgi:hypothetical protein
MNKVHILPRSIFNHKPYILAVPKNRKQIKGVKNRTNKRRGL